MCVMKYFFSLCTLLRLLYMCASQSLSLMCYNSITGQNISYGNTTRLTTILFLVAKDIIMCMRVHFIQSPIAN